MKTIFSEIFPIGFYANSRSRRYWGTIGVDTGVMEQFGKDYIYNEDIPVYVKGNVEKNITEEIIKRFL